MLWLVEHCLLLCIHRGILLKDLVAIDAQGKDYGSDQRINLTKYRLLWTTLSGIRAAQMCNTTLTVDTDHMRILRVSLPTMFFQISLDPT